jgi:hypothetical protein
LAGNTATATIVQTGSNDRVSNMREFARQALELLAGALNA